MFIRIYKFGHDLLSAESQKQSDVGQHIRIARKMYCFNFEKQYICVLELFKELKQLCTENGAGFVKSCTVFSANC